MTPPTVVLPEPRDGEGPGRPADCSRGQGAGVGGDRGVAGADRDGARPGVGTREVAQGAGAADAGADEARDRLGDREPRAVDLDRGTRGDGRARGGRAEGGGGLDPDDPARSPWWPRCRCWRPRGPGCRCRSWRGSPLPAITPPTVRVVAVLVRVAVPVSAIPRLAARVKVAVVARVAAPIVSCPGVAEAGTAPRAASAPIESVPRAHRGGPGVGVGAREDQGAGAGLDEGAAARDHAPDGEGGGGVGHGRGAGERDPPVGGQGEGRGAWPGWRRRS